MADQTIELAFHGSPRANEATILRDGLDPSRRRRQAYGPGEYFGWNAATSLGYGDGSTLIVFALLLDRTGVTHRDGTLVVVHRADHQLPLFAVTFGGAEGGPETTFFGPTK